MNTKVTPLRTALLNTPAFGVVSASEYDTVLSNYLNGGGAISAASIVQSFPITWPIRPGSP